MWLGPFHFRPPRLTVAYVAHPREQNYGQVWRDHIGRLFTSLKEYRINFLATKPKNILQNHSVVELGIKSLDPPSFFISNPTKKHWRSLHKKRNILQLHHIHPRTQINDKKSWSTPSLAECCKCLHLLGLDAIFFKH